MPGTSRIERIMMTKPDKTEKQDEPKAEAKDAKGKGPDEGGRKISVQFDEEELALAESFLAYITEQKGAHVVRMLRLSPASIIRYAASEGLAGFGKKMKAGEPIL